MSASSSSSFWRPSKIENASANAANSSIYRGEGENLLIGNKFKHLSIQQQRSLLPIAKYKHEILYALEKFRTIILIGETGCGKSTQIPRYLYDAGWTSSTSTPRCVACTQPRRIAAVSVANRVASEFGCEIGEEVGYGVRFDFKCSDRTVIRYYTDGVLLRETMSDPLLSKYSVIIVDEAHQRSLHSDVLLGLLKKIQRSRPELRLIITSATLDAAALKAFFEIDSVPAKDSVEQAESSVCMLSVQGRQHSVEVQYLQRPTSDYIKSAVDTVLSIHENEDVGDILVFLPGGEDIDTAIALLNERYSFDQEEVSQQQSKAPSGKKKRARENSQQLFFLPLYSSLPSHTQQAVFLPTPPNMRKVVLATNIAETSITIEGIRFVIDSCFVKLNFFDVRSGVDALVVCPVSRAAATQRAGRAGRTENGKCFRLATESFFKSDSIKDHSPPEMQRCDITWAILQLKALGIDDVLHFDFLSPPPSDAIVYALELLYSLKAIDEKGKMTDRGEMMSEMPLEPRLAAALLQSFDFGCGEEMLTIAAMSAVENPFINIRKGGAANKARLQKLQEDWESFAVRGSDHLTMLNVFSSFEESGANASWCDANSLQFKILSRAKEIRGNLLNMLKQFSRRKSNRESGDFVISSCCDDRAAVLKCLVSGFFAHAAKLNSSGQYRTVRGNVSVSPHAQSVVAQLGSPPEWVIFGEIFLTKDSVEMREVSKIDPLWLVQLAEHYYSLKM